MSARAERRDGGAPRERRLYRDPANGLLFGVCAGVSAYFGVDRTALRVVTAVAAVFFLPTVLLAYLALALLLPKRPRASTGEDAGDEAFGRDLDASPRATLSVLRHRCRELELRLQRLERYVTSSRFELDREFRDLGRG